VALVLTVIPLYLLLLRLFDARIALVGSTFFCVLPEVSRLGADGISDGTHLLFFTAALWAIVEYWAARTVGMARGRAWLVLAGLLTGLALLARAEAIILAVALVISLVGFVVARRSKPVLRTVNQDGAGYALGLMVVLGPYLLLAGVDTPQVAMTRVLGRPTVAAPDSLARQADKIVWRTPEGRPLRFTAKEGTIRSRGYAAALCQYGEELAHVFGFGLGILALWAAWRHRRELVRPADRLLQTFFVAFSLAVIHFVAQEGYLSARHLLPLLVAGIGMASVGAWELGTLLHRKSAPASLAIVVLIVLTCFASTSRPLHANRLAHRQAGTWLARESRDDAVVLDTRGWTALYSARPTYQYDQAKTALGDRRLRYIVVEPRELRFSSGRARTLRYLLDTAGECVARFAGSGGTTDDETAVAVYRWHAERFRPRSPRLARTVSVRKARVLE
ncbi:MAG: glycosyltransferase family 39 protein, partial [Pirellulales bacterium]|nr:glycosyltransferase family 39 protein [Pirellulales bacterium]